MYLITGGAGFIGSNIAKTLVEKGEKVKVLDNLSTGNYSNLQDIIDNIQFFQGDINDLELLSICLQDVRYILHQAALPSVPRSVANPVASNEAIVDGTVKLLTKACEVGVKRVVLASSSSVYGSNPKLPKQEDMELSPLSPYAVGKCTTEMYAKVFAHLYDIETVSLRYFNIFGPRQNPYSQYAAVIPRFINRMLSGEPPVIFGDGEQSRDFTYIDNAVETNILACHSPHVGNGEAINVACGDRFSLNELVNMLNRVLNTDIKPNYDDPRPGDVKHSMADINKAKELLNYDIEVSMEEGLSKTVEYLRQEYPEVKDGQAM